MLQRLRLSAIICLLLASCAIAQDMPLSQILISGEGWELVADGFTYTEGPAVDREGNLFFTDIPNNKIYKLAGDGKPVVFVEESDRTNGLMFGLDGRLYGCCNGKRQIVAFDAEAKPAVIADDVLSNDLVVSSNGSIYFTDPENHRVWYVDPKGQKRVVDEGIERPNGIILWPDQKTLVVADSNGVNLWTFRVEADGSLKHKQPYYTTQLPTGRTASGADGMTVDSQGRLYVATRVGLQVFDTQGRLSGIIAKPQETSLSNVVFAGPKLDTLYVTSADKVYRRKVNATGVRYGVKP
jgi:gluconolactonase